MQKLPSSPELQFSSLNFFKKILKRKSLSERDQPVALNLELPIESTLVNNTVPFKHDYVKGSFFLKKYQIYIKPCPLLSPAPKEK